MQFHPTAIGGVIRIDIDAMVDSRGFFARTWCDREAAAAGLRTPMVQSSMAFNAVKGTLRGLHYHAAPFPQARVIRCAAGAAFAVAVDLRPDSASYCASATLTIDAVTHAALYVPPGVALGYQTLADRTVVYYQMPEYYDPSFERGVRWDDPAFAIDWPDRRPILNERDATYPDFDADAFRAR